MTAPALPAIDTPILVGPAPTPNAAWARLRGDRRAWLGLGVIVVLLLAAIFAPLIDGADPIRIDLRNALQRPSATHWLGTDAQGRDVWSRLVHGARISLLVGLASQGIALSIGLVLGLVAGYRGKWTEEVIMRLADVTLAFPSLLLLIAMAAAFEPSLTVVCTVIGVVGWAGMARLVRGQVLVVRELEYVQAMRALGARDRRILLHHVLPNVIAPVVIAATLGIAGAIMAEAALSFLGLGVQPPTPSWGAMIADGRDLSQLRNAPWTSLAPGLAIGVAVLGFNLLGDALRDALDPRGARRVPRCTASSSTSCFFSCRDHDRSDHSSARRCRPACAGIRLDGQRSRDLSQRGERRSDAAVGGGHGGEVERVARASASDPDVADERRRVHCAVAVCGARRRRC